MVCTRLSESLKLMFWYLGVQINFKGIFKMFLRGAHIGYTTSNLKKNSDQMLLNSHPPPISNSIFKINAFIFLDKN